MPLEFCEQHSLENVNGTLSVCMLITDIDYPGAGIQMQSNRLLKELHKCGVGTYVCARNYHHRSRKEQRDGVVIRRSPVVSRSTFTLNSISYILDSLSWLILNRKKYDVIHCQQMFGPAMVGLLAKKILRKPVLVRVTTTGNLGEVRHVQKMPLARLRLRQLRNVDCWIALTEEMKREICTLGISPEKIVIIHNSTTLPALTASAPNVRERSRTQLGLKYSKIAVFTGRLSKEKGLDSLLYAWRLVVDKVPEAHLLLLGEGGEFRNVEAELRHLRDELNLERVVHFLGYKANVVDYLLCSDVFVLPSYVEGMSNSLVEAMGAGVAIVATDIPANRELIENGSNGILVPPGDAASLGAAMISVFQSPGLCQMLGDSAREKAKLSLDLKITTQKYLTVYHKLLSASSPQSS